MPAVLPTRPVAAEARRRRAGEDPLQVLRKALSGVLATRRNTWSVSRKEEVADWQTAFFDRMVTRWRPGANGLVSSRWPERGESLSGLKLHPLPYTWYAVRHPPGFQADAAVGIWVFPALPLTRSVAFVSGGARHFAMPSDTGAEDSCAASSTRSPSSAKLAVMNMRPADTRRYLERLRIGKISGESHHVKVIP